MNQESPGCTLLDIIADAQFIFTIDLTKGRPPWPPRIRKRMAFAIPVGLYNVIQMPFGLHGAAASFQRVMDKALAYVRE